MVPRGAERTALALPFAAGIAVTTAAAVLLWPREDPDIERYRAVRDWTRLAFVRPVENDELLDDALRGLADGLDPWSSWYDRSDLARLERETEGRFHGLGVSMRMPSGDGRILFPLPGGPAERAGIRAGDRILRVAGQAWSELGQDGFRAMVSTPEPRDVDLVVAGLDGAERHVVVRTASVVEPTVRHERWVDPERRLGYVALRAFSSESPAELDAALERLARGGLRGLVLDLRGNPGGVLNAAVRIASRFVGQGEIVRTLGRRERVVHEASESPARWSQIALVALVDESSASAAEVLAGALQDHRAGVLVGMPTYGKGAVQTIHRLSDQSGAIKVTTSRYETPAGQRLDRPHEDRGHGLVPDVLVTVDGATQRAVREFLERASPPERWKPVLAEWEAREGVAVLPLPPADPQLDVAVALLRGERPGPELLERAP
ncbi:MAG: PDZ domain-containing protein [Planctomycetes bacterium]|nr:PDZ domain-containing protein [Planctomycetota bacterium]